jgi:hypothetical protein
MTLIDASNHRGPNSNDEQALRFRAAGASDRRDVCATGFAPRATLRCRPRGRLDPHPQLLLRKKQCEIHAQSPVRTALRLFCVVASADLKLHQLWSQFHHLRKLETDRYGPLVGVPIVSGFGDEDQRSPVAELTLEAPHGSLGRSRQTSGRKHSADVFSAHGAGTEIRRRRYVTPSLLRPLLPAISAELRGE